MAEGWYLLEGLNPEPWTASEGAIGRKSGKVFVMFHKPAGLTAYQEAIKEEMARQYGTEPPYASGVPLTVEFYFWRELPAYEGDKRKVRKHQADATNMQKALEDALQGVLYANDRDVRIIKSCIVEQGPDVEPKILIRVSDLPATTTVEEATSILSGITQSKPPRQPDLPERPVDDLF